MIELPIWFSPGDVTGHKGHPLRGCVPSVPRHAGQMSRLSRMSLNLSIFAGRNAFGDKLSPNAAAQKTLGEQQSPPAGDRVENRNGGRDES